MRLKRLMRLKGVLSPLFYQDDQICVFPPLHDARKWLRKYVREKRDKRDKSLFITRGVARRAAVQTGNSLPVRLLPGPEGEAAVVILCALSALCALKETPRNAGEAVAPIVL